MNVFQMMDTRMRYLNVGQRITAENMANLHTPGYKARQLAPLVFGDRGHTFHMAQTQAHHLGTGLNKGAVFRVQKNRETHETISRNTVSATEELSSANEMALWHRQMANALRANVQMLDMALKR